MTKILADYPAYTIIEDKDREYADGEEIAVPYQSMRHGILYNFYQLGSVEAYARKNGVDPVEQVERAKRLGHKLYYAFGLATVITAWKQAKKTVPAFEIGDTILFAGKKFRIDRAPNHNINLEEI